MSSDSRQDAMGTLCSLQILRGAAAWMVVYHHYMQIFHNWEHATTAGAIFTEHGGFGVDIFFVISGFIIFWSLHLKGYSAREFLIRRLLRIVPCYWFMTLVFVIFIEILSLPHHMPVSWDIKSLVLSLLFLPHQHMSGMGLFPVLAVGWTLNFEVFFYLGLSGVLSRVRRHWFAVWSGILFALPVMFANSTFPYSSILKSNLLYEFAFGMSAGYLYLRLRNVQQWRQVLLGIVLLLVGGWIYWAGITHLSPFDFSKMRFIWRIGDLTRPVSSLLFIGSALAFEASLPRGLLSRMLCYLGDISYSTYLVHVPAGIIVFNLVKVLRFSVAEVWTLGAYTILTLTLSVLSYRWIETGQAVIFLKQGLLPQRARS